MSFSKATLDFLFENRMRDSKAWFEEHKEDYRRLVLEPLCELTRQLTPTMLGIDGQFITEPRVDKTICRIRRDTRFSHDPSLYRDNMWIIFKRGRMHTTEFPGMYVEITNEGFDYGCGFYHASTGWLNTMRELILHHDPAFEAAQHAFASQKTFVMEGDCFKRPHYADQPPELQQWLERRGISFNAYSTDFNLLFSDCLAEKLAKELKQLAPVYRFLLEVSLAQQKKEAANAMTQQHGLEW